MGLRDSQSYFIQRVAGNQYNAIRLNLEDSEEGNNANIEIHDKLEVFKAMDKESRNAILSEQSSSMVFQNKYTNVGEIYVTYEELQVGA